MNKDIEYTCECGVVYDIKDNKPFKLECRNCKRVHNINFGKIEWTTTTHKERMIHQFGQRVSVVYNLSTTHISVIKDGTVIRTTEGITDVKEYQKFLESVAIDAYTLQSFNKEDNEEKL